MYSYLMRGPSTYTVTVVKIISNLCIKLTIVFSAYTGILSFGLF